MKNISINKFKISNDINREIELNNGSLVLLKNNGEVRKVFMVVSFRDNKNHYKGDPTNNYCTLLNLDTGYFAFEERCSRKTTVKRVLNHLLDLSCDSPVYNDFDIDVIKVNSYKIDVSF